MARNMNCCFNGIGQKYPQDTDQVDHFDRHLLDILIYLNMDMAPLTVGGHKLCGEKAFERGVLYICNDNDIMWRRRHNAQTVSFGQEEVLSTSREFEEISGLQDEMIENLAALIQTSAEETVIHYDRAVKIYAEIDIFQLDTDNGGQY